MAYESHGLRYQAMTRLQCMSMLLISLALTACADYGESSTGLYQDRPEERRNATVHSASGTREASPGNFHHPEFSTSLEKKLILTNEQGKAFARIEANYRKMVIKKTADIRAHEIELARLLETEQPERSALQKEAEIIGDLKVELMMSRMDSLLKLKGILTQGQYLQFRTILRNRMETFASTSPH